MLTRGTTESIWTRQACGPAMPSLHPLGGGARGSSALLPAAPAVPHPVLQKPPPPSQEADTKEPVLAGGDHGPCGLPDTTVTHSTSEGVVCAPTQPPTGAHTALRVYKGPCRPSPSPHLTPEEVMATPGSQSWKGTGQGRCPRVQYRTHTA